MNPPPLIFDIIYGYPLVCCLQLLTLETCPSNCVCLCVLLLQCLNVTVLFTNMTLCFKATPVLVLSLLEAFIVIFCSNISFESLKVGKYPVQVGKQKESYACLTQVTQCSVCNYNIVARAGSFSLYHSKQHLSKIRVSQSQIKSN